MTDTFILEGTAVDMTEERTKVEHFIVQDLTVEFEKRDEQNQGSDCSENQEVRIDEKDCTNTYSSPTDVELQL